MIDITLIGTSALLPLPDRALTSVLLEFKGHSVLFDCGEGTQSAARKAGVNAAGAEIIALSHYHGDHIFGLPGLLQTMNTMDRPEPLYITGPKGLSEAMEPILKLVGNVCYDIILIENNKLNEIVGKWDERAALNAFPTKHSVISCGYSFELGRAGKFNPERASELGVPMNMWSVLQKGESVNVEGKTIEPCEVLGKERKGLKFVFTGDTTACESLVNAAKGANLLISEATFSEDDQAEIAAEYGHMTFSEAAKVAKQAEVKRLWLSHFSQRIQDPQEHIEKATEIFPNTEIGKDGKQITLRFED